MGAAPAGRLHSHLNYKAHFACQDQNTTPHIYGEPQRVDHGVQGMEANKTHLHKVSYELKGHFICFDN